MSHVFMQKVDESSAYYKEQVSQAKQIMQPFTLRRLKSEVRMIINWLFSEVFDLNLEVELCIIILL